ncbi:MAG: ATP-binding protein [Actinomycetota bacterium]
MERSTADAGAVRRSLAVLAFAGAALVVVALLGLHGPRARSAVSDLALTLALGLSGAMILLRPRIAVAQRRPLGVLLLAGAAVHGAFLVHDLVSSGATPFGGASAADVLFLVPGALVLVSIRDEFLTHFRREDRREAVADVMLVTAAVGGFVFLMLQPSMSGAGDVSSVVFAAAVAAPVAWGALAAWAPSARHIALFAAWSSLAAGTLGFGSQWIRHDYMAGQAAIDLPIGLGALALAAVAISASPRQPGDRSIPVPRRLRPILTVTAVSAACTSLGVAAAMETTGRVRPLEASVTIGLLAAAIAIRILFNQVRTTRATGDVARALADKDETLRETDQTLHRLQDMHDSLAASEGRMRLLFDVAVDGIVELDGEGVIRRANEAFCTMMLLPQEEILGRTWQVLAAAVPDGGPSLAALPITGQAVLERDGNEIHLAGRASELPGPESGQLLVIRDVSADKVAEMTIRSLFKFLQDRDEDRSRLLRRTNSAIEAERNRIARDLHDGPVQGISAASLSLEAVLLMLRTGDVEGGMEMLGKIREEISMETDNLRRLMSDLRPPVLEERGLIPALRDTLARFGRDFGVTTQFHSRALVDVPADLETLAYRVVQEALTNAAKHARASEVTVSVEAEAGQLRVEVTDNGDGFEPGRAREFLRSGRVGLASMRERTELASGTFMVRSTPGMGTAVVATLPLDPVPSMSTEAVLR